MNLCKRISWATIRTQSLFVALIVGTFIAFGYSPPAHAQCAEGEAEIVISTPSGKTKFLCLPGEAVENIENTPDHAAGTIDVTLRSGEFNFDDLTPNVDVPSSLSSGNVILGFFLNEASAWQGADAEQSIGASALRLTPDQLDSFASGAFFVNAANVGLLGFSSHQWSFDMQRPSGTDEDFFLTCVGPWVLFV